MYYIESNLHCYLERNLKLIRKYYDSLDFKASQLPGLLFHLTKSPSYFVAQNKDILKGRVKNERGYRLIINLIRAIDRYQFYFYLLRHEEKMFKNV